ncbi:MAG: hypothetical protein JW876_07075 [Candidatus Krumholzibacteriota bacterium]|nr:hypothetical protein [Candidatus Krumholzibacteriota bacterium]
MRNAFAAAVLAAALVAASVPAGAEEGYASLYPCLADLDGWTADDPEGMEMNMPGMSSVHATRHYEAEGREATATILVGNMAAAAGMGGGAAAAGMAHVETDEGKFEMREVDGFVTYVVFDKEERRGNVTVHLFTEDEGKTAIFALAFEGMGIDDGYELARRFDWQDIKKRVASLE